MISLPFHVRFNQPAYAAKRKAGNKRRVSRLETCTSKPVGFPPLVSHKKGKIRGMQVMKMPLVVRWCTRHAGTLGRLTCHVFQAAKPDCLIESNAGILRLVVLFVNSFFVYRCQSRKFAF